jgi:hypothetical protein
MNATKAVSLALLALTIATPALAQSRTVVQNQPQTAPDPLALLGPGWSHPANPLAATSSALDAVAMGLATATVYHFTSADYPGAGYSIVFDMNTKTGTVVGDFQFSSTSQTGFTLRGILYQSFVVPGSLPGSLLTGINTSGKMVGIYTDTSNVTHGVLDNAGVFTKIDEPSGSTIPYDINDSGEIVGQYTDTSHVIHGFSTHDNGTTFTNFDFPGATATIAGGVNTAGVITGQWTDSTSKLHGFVLNGGVFNSIDFPLATDTTAIGINDSNEIAGYYTNATSTHGFIYFLSNGTFARVDVAGSSGTEVSRIKNNGQITGVYIDATGEYHGMTGR